MQSVGCYSMVSWNSELSHIHIHILLQLLCSWLRVTSIMKNDVWIKKHTSLHERQRVSEYALPYSWVQFLNYNRYSQSTTTMTILTQFPWINESNTEYTTPICLFTIAVYLTEEPNIVASFKREISNKMARLRSLRQVRSHIHTYPHTHTHTIINNNNNNDNNNNYLSWLVTERVRERESENSIRLCVCVHVHASTSANLNKRTHSYTHIYKNMIISKNNNFAISSKLYVFMGKYTHTTNRMTIHCNKTLASEQY